MNEIISKVIEAVRMSKASFCKFISANDAGLTGAHQSGFYIPKTALSLIFDELGVKGTNKDRYVKIKWQCDIETESRFIYYGTKTRNEYRITRFGKHFPFLNKESVGNLFILCKIEEDFYEAFILESDEEFDAFFSEFNINASETNKLIPKSNLISAEDSLLLCFKTFIDSLNNQFPPTQQMAFNSRNCYNKTFRVSIKEILNNPDKILLKWIKAEFDLFKTLENNIYANQLKETFSNAEELVSFANTVLNRRKSRAGKSLEFHLEEIFKVSELEFETQVITEGNKKPDFIFPNILAYHNQNFDADKLRFLASKTTCKDRWRQVINEADRIPIKHLFTLQQGISSNQLLEMKQHGVKLVIPAMYLKCFPEQDHKDILTLDTFVKQLKILQDSPTVRRV